MPMPEGIVSVLIDKETGCPARAGQPNVIFEVFREGHVPECEAVEELPDIFNDTTGLGDQNAGDADDAEEQKEESLF